MAIAAEGESRDGTRLDVFEVGVVVPELQGRARAETCEHQADHPVEVSGIGLARVSGRIGVKRGQPECDSGTWSPASDVRVAEVALGAVLLEGIRDGLPKPVSHLSTRENPG